jgi:hypothetical protein
MRRKVRQIYENKWYCMAKERIEECCKCGYKHYIENKIDKRGRIWVKVWVIK